MSLPTAENLAGEVKGGTYRPGTFLECKPDLPLDRTPSRVRFHQFVLFENPHRSVSSPGDPEYLILQQYRFRIPPGQPGPEAILGKLVKQMAGHLNQEFEVTEEESPVGGRPGPLPDTVTEEGRFPPAAGTRIDLLREISERRRIAGYHDGLPDTEVRKLYEDWLAGRGRENLQEFLVSLERAGFSFTEEMAENPGGGQALLEKVLSKVFLAAPFQPFVSPHPHFALCATFEQVWEAVGYTRGELINSISLAPGEQLTLEFHSWDKSVYKKLEELITETELRRSETLTQRDSLAVTRESSSKFGSHLDASAEVTIYGVPVQMNGGVNTEVTRSLSQTLTQNRDRTVQASESLKASRKQHIEVSREVGRELKQVRVISNTNRCHTLNCHYFEVMTNYLVTTRFVSVEPCLLLPNPKGTVTPEWVLCHEDLLKRSLLDKVYLPGFDGARTLETREELKRLRKEEAKARGEVPSQLEQDLQRHVDSILDAYERLKAAVKKVKKAAGSWECRFAAAGGGALGLAVCVVARSGVDRLRRVLFMAMLACNENAVNALKALQSSAGNTRPSECLRSFFAAAGPRDFQFNPVTAAAAQGLDAIGVPGKLVDGLLGWGLLDLLADDAGLAQAVQAANVRLEESWQLPPEEVEEAPQQDRISLLEAAAAEVAFNQLKCHIEDNLLHYMQAIWRSESSDDRFLRLQSYGAVSGILGGELLGFLGHKSALPITDLESVKRWVDFPALISDVTTSMAHDEPPPQLIAMPTQGTVLEAILGTCDGCEDFIRESRVIDLRVQDAKARQEESEAGRFEKRVESGDYSDPKVLAGGKVVISIAGEGPQSPA